ncbi:hypothetical protein AURDEDRAFT_170840 [Auricularia subglabra TFB-10046 SS5]|nr:hypothetical protein AURDEDRAFT_170840 [Auricularia subglabra TFB-10046 SS5]
MSSLPQCGFCGCANFWWTPPPPTPGVPPPQTPLPHDPCSYCSHTFLEHAPIPQTGLCRGDRQSCRCRAFLLASRGRRLFNCTCQCGHAFAEHVALPDAAARLTPAPTTSVAPTPAVVRPSAFSAPASGGALAPSMSHVVLPPPSPAQPPPRAPAPSASSAASPTRAHAIELFTVAAEGVGTANQQRRDAAARHRVPGGPTPRGAIGSRVQPPPPVHAVPSSSHAPAPSSASTTSARHSAAPYSATDLDQPTRPRKRGPKPNAKANELHTRVIIFPVDPSQNFDLPSSFPPLDELGLQPGFNCISFLPVHYDVFVQRMRDLNLVFEINLDASKTDPGSLHAAIMDAILRFLQENGFTLDTSRNPPAPGSTTFRLLTPRKHTYTPKSSSSPATSTSRAGPSSVPAPPPAPVKRTVIRFASMEVSADVLSLRHLTRKAASVMESGDIYAAPKLIEWFLHGLLTARRFARPSDVVVALGTLAHPCFPIRAVDYYRDPGSREPGVVAGRCEAICQRLSSSRSTERNSPMPLDEHADANDNAHDDFPDHQSQWPAPDYDHDAFMGDSAEWDFTPLQPLATQQDSRSPATYRFLQQLSAHVQNPASLAPDLHVPLSPSPPRRPGAHATSSVIELSDHSDTDSSAQSDTAPTAPHDHDHDQGDHADDPPAQPPTYDNWQVYNLAFSDHLARIKHTARPPHGAAYFVYKLKPDKPSVGKVMGRILLYLSAPMRHAADDIAQLIQDEFSPGSDDVTCEEMTLKNIALCKNYFKVQEGSGPGPERMTISATLLYFVSNADYWHARHGHYTPRKRAPIDPNDEELLRYRAAGLAAAWALLRYGYIPFIDPAFFFLLLAWHFLSLPLKSPSLLELLVDEPYLALVAPDKIGALKLWPKLHTDPLPAPDSSADAQTLFTLCCDVNIDPRRPRRLDEHKSYTLAVFSYALFEVNLCHTTELPEWEAFFQGFNLDIAFANKPSHACMLSRCFYTFQGDIGEPATIAALKNLSIALLCPPPDPHSIIARLSAYASLQRYAQLAEQVLELVTAYLLGVGHPQGAAELLGLEPTPDPQCNLRSSIFVRTVLGTPYLPPAQPDDTDYSLVISLVTPIPRVRASNPELGDDVQPFTFATCGRAIDMPVNDAFRVLVADSIAILRNSPPADPSPDTPFHNVLHSQLITPRMDQYTVL